MFSPGLFKFSVCLTIEPKIYSFQFSVFFCLSFSFLPSVNTRPPVLYVNGSLLVPLDSFALLPPTLLHVKDPDSPPDWLIFQLIQGPSNGRLVLFKAQEGEERGAQGKAGQELNRDDIFTWEELKTGWVRFKHQKDKARSVDLL